MRASTLAAALVLALASPVAALAQTTSPAPAAAPGADPDDVSSPEAIIDAVYEVISGDAGVARDWDRFRSLFHPAARLIPSGVRPDGTIVASSLTPEDYVTRAGPQLERDGFHEIEIASTSEQFGSVVHVFSTYEARRSLDDAEPFLRGINSFQLMFDGTRWWVLTIYWRAEDDSLPIPDEYLP